MLQLLAAIHVAFANTASLTSVFPRGLENAESADASALPSCLLVEVSCVNDYSTKSGSNPSYIEEAHIQFTLRSVDGTLVRTAMENIQTLFDHHGLALTTDKLLDARKSGMDRVIREDERVYRGDVEYKFTVGRALP